MNKEVKTNQELGYGFSDAEVDRRNSDSAKWNTYAEDVIPMWVADMDFRSPKAVMDALHARVDQGTFGYASDAARLRQLLCERMASLYNWQITPEQILFIPGLVSGLNVVARSSGERGSGLLVNTPIYPPFLTAPINQERELHEAPLAVTRRQDSQRRSYLHYEVDFDALTAAVRPNTRMFIFCNPHNPVGRAYNRAELEAIADFCLRHNLQICSDEIHSDLLLDGNQHIPIAAVSDELAQRSITLIAPSKTFNIPGLGCSIAIVPNPEVRQHLQHTASGIIPHVNLLGLVAATAAYEHGDGWLEQLKSYLTANRDLVFDFVTRNLPQVELTLPEATYLGWLDFRPLGIDDPYTYFLEHAKVALSSGTHFGEPGKGFARLNFGTNQRLLQQGLDRIAQAVATANPTK